MKFIDLARKRRSLRHYLDKPIQRRELLSCLEAGRLAPSACNAQPWKFVIIDDKKTINRLSQEIFHTVYSFNKFAGQAAAWIVAASDKETFLRKAAGRFKGTNYYLIDIGIACEHIVLEAESLGIGSCWIGWFDEKKLKRSLAIPKKNKLDIIIALGYPKSKVFQPKTRKPLDKITFFHNSAGKNNAPA